MHNESIVGLNRIITNHVENAEVPSRGVFLLGNPGVPRYSRSPDMWNAVFSRFGIEARYKPLGFDVDKYDSVEDALKLLSTDPDFLGANVTNPFKKPVYKTLTEIGSLDISAARVGAVNPIVNKNGFLTGYNTDARGEVESLRTLIPDFSGFKLLAIGAGGAGTA